MYVLKLYFGWPAGAVWSNVIAQPIIVGLALVLAYVFRDRIGRRLVAFWHRHHTAHLESLKAREDAK